MSLESELDLATETTLLDQPDPVRLLLVDDDEDDCVLLQSLIENTQNLHLDCVTTAEEARKQLLRERYHLCLLDYRLGPADGLELLRELRDLGFQGPIVVLTGDESRETDLAATQAGAADFISKAQLDEDRLERCVRYALAQARLRSEQVARAKAEAADQAKDEFVAMVSHELRSPMQTMALNIELLKRSGDTEAQDRALQGLERGMNSLRRLVEDLLDTTRMTRGDLALDLEPLELSPVVASVVEAREGAARQQGVELALVGDIEGRDRLLGDRTRLEQVLENLVGNAIKFTPEGGRVTVTLDGDADQVFVEVRDTGPGIAPDLLPHIFERFRQGKNDGQRGGGLGLGLSIAHKLVEIHGGELEAANDQGAVFKVTLPRHLRDAPEADA